MGSEMCIRDRVSDEKNDPVPINLAKAIPQPTAYAVPTVNIGATPTSNIGPIQDPELFIDRALVGDVQNALMEMRVPATEEHASNILRELKRMTKATALAKNEGTYQNNYHTWVAVNKQFYEDRFKYNEAWNLQSKVLKMMMNQQK